MFGTPRHLFSMSYVSHDAGIFGTPQVQVQFHSYNNESVTLYNVTIRDVGDVVFGTSHHRRLLQRRKPNLTSQTH
jgi:hypothetical protein